MQLPPSEDLEGKKNLTIDQYFELRVKLLILDRMNMQNERSNLNRPPTTSSSQVNSNVINCTPTNFQFTVMNIKKTALSIALTVSTLASTANISSAKELPVESGSIAPVKTYNANTVAKSSKSPNKNTPTLIASQYLGAGDMDFCFDISTQQQQQSQECLPSITRGILYMPSRPKGWTRFIIKNSYYYYYFLNTKRPDTALTTALLNSDPNTDKAVYVRAKNESGFARAWRTSVSDFNGRPQPAIGFVIEKRP